MSSQTTPSTSDTSESFIADDSLRHMKLVGGMLVNWGGDTYRGDLLPEHLTPEVRKEFANNYSVLKE